MRNCLSYALDKWHKEGGYFQCRRSGHWGIAHALHQNVEGEVSGYVPHGELRKPTLALLGFDGVYTDGDDKTLAKPMSVLGIVASAWILALGATGWAIWRMVK